MRAKENNGYDLWCGWFCLQLSWRRHPLFSVRYGALNVLNYMCTHYILLFTNWLTSFIQYSGGRLAKKVPYAPQTPSLKLIINTVFDLLHACFIKCHQTNEKNNCHHEQKYFFPPPEVPNPSLPGWKGTFEYKQTSNTSAQWRVGRRKGNGHVLGPRGGGVTLPGAD